MLFTSSCPASGESGTGDAVLRIVLADDHQIMRQGLVSLLEGETDIEVVAEAGDGQEAVALARQHEPHAVVMDVTMPNLNGVEATRQIKQELPKTRIIGLSIHQRVDMADAMRRAGAEAYLTKDGPADDLLAAIRDGDDHPR
jgi:DNA-binding NarL/FixJ family response regulator